MLRQQFCEWDLLGEQCQEGTTPGSSRADPVMPGMSYAA